MTTDPQTAVEPQYVYVVSEIRDGVLRRTHGHFASLQGAFGYCEAEERKKPLFDSVQVKPFAAPGGRRWLVHIHYGPKEDWPEVSDFVISRHEVIPDAPATRPAPNRRPPRSRVARRPAPPTLSSRTRRRP